MERELALTGIGGQGVQLAGQVLARAATHEDRHVTMFGLYGGMMRGGSTDCTVIVADEPILAPPIVSSVWSAIAMHDEHWDPLSSKVARSAFVLANADTFAKEPAPGVELVTIDATRAATEVGAAMAASMVMVGAYVAMTELVAPASIEHAVRESIPSYRRQHVDVNLAAVEAGTQLVESARHPAWTAERVG